MDSMMIISGCIGGAVPDFIRIIQGRYAGALPGYLMTFNFWIGFILLVILGGFTVWLGEPKSIKEALAYGFAAPEIISRLLSSSQGPTLGIRGGQIGALGEHIRHFWSY